MTIRIQTSLLEEISEAMVGELLGDRNRESQPVLPATNIEMDINTRMSHPSTNQTKINVSVHSVNSIIVHTQLSTLQNSDH